MIRENNSVDNAEVAPTISKNSRKNSLIKFGILDLSPESRKMELQIDQMGDRGMDNSFYPCLGSSRLLDLPIGSE